MARTIWTGSVSFGLVNVPVGLYSATEDRTIRFHQLHRGTSDRVRYQRINERTGEEVAYNDIVKGHDAGGGEYVVVEPEELEAIAPGRSQSIDIVDFVDLDEIDPIFFNRTYYLGPRGQGSERTYALLLEALRQTNRVGIATFVMRNKQYLAAVRPEKNVLALETMHFADEVRDPVREINALPVKTEYSNRELNTATQLIESLTTEWRPEEYRDTYRERVAELVDAKRRGEEVVTEGEAPESTNVVDLASVLEQSLQAARGGDRTGNGSEAQTDGGDDLTELSKKELYDRAAELGVAKRSRMSRDELEQAVRQAGDGATAAQKAS